MTAIGCMIGAAVALLSAMYRHEDSHEVESAVHDAWLRLSCGGHEVTPGFLVQEAKMLIRHRAYQRRHRERRRVPMPKDVADRTPSLSDRPGVREAMAALPPDQLEAVFRFLGGEGMRDRKTIRAWESAKAKIGRRVSPAGDRVYMSRREAAAAAGVSEDAVYRLVRHRGMTDEQAIRHLQGD